MVERPTPSQEPVPSTETEEQPFALEPTELVATAPAAPAISVPAELLAQSGDGYYARHWGINE